MLSQIRETNIEGIDLLPETQCQQTPPPLPAFIFNLIGSSWGCHLVTQRLFFFSEFRLWYLAP